MRGWPSPSWTLTAATLEVRKRKTEGYFSWRENVSLLFDLQPSLLSSMCAICCEHRTQVRSTEKSLVCVKILWQPSPMQKCIFFVQIYLNKNNRKNPMSTVSALSADQIDLFVFLFPDDQRSSVNESSSLLGGSPQRHCQRKSSPYHTGQLHPAVRVADLLQHINQMKTSEGYGFKQEYEVRKDR